MLLMLMKEDFTKTAFIDKILYIYIKKVILSILIYLKIKFIPVMEVLEV